MGLLNYGLSENRLYIPPKSHSRSSCSHHVPIFSHIFVYFLIFSYMFPYFPIFSYIFRICSHIFPYVSWLRYTPITSLHQLPRKTRGADLLHHPTSIADGRFTRPGGSFWVRLWKDPPFLIGKLSINGPSIPMARYVNGLVYGKS